MNTERGEMSSFQGFSDQQEEIILYCLGRDSKNNDTLCCGVKLGDNHWKRDYRFHKHGKEQLRSKPGVRLIPVTECELCNKSSS